MHGIDDTVIKLPEGQKGSVPPGWQSERVSTVEMYGRFLEWFGKAVGTTSNYGPVQMLYMQLPDCHTSLCVVVAGHDEAGKLAALINAQREAGQMRVG